jgi:hypothetical protein
MNFLTIFKPKKQVEYLIEFEVNSITQQTATFKAQSLWTVKKQKRFIAILMSYCTSYEYVKVLFYTIHLDGSKIFAGSQVFNKKTVGT